MASLSCLIPGMGFAVFVCQPWGQVCWKGRCLDSAYVANQRHDSLQLSVKAPKTQQQQLARIDVKYLAQDGGTRLKTH